MKNLTDLIINNNHLSEIDLLTNLTNLRVLNVASNDIAVFPAGLTNLVLLKDFDCNSNSIKDLTNFTPCSAFSAMQVLNLSGNELKKLPREIGTLITLEKFMIHENELTDLPSEIGLLANVVELCLVHFFFL
jgi:Leucine-rich repeat (LRR) protein